MLQVRFAVALWLVVVSCNRHSPPTNKADPDQETIAFVDVSVIPMDRERILRRHTVVVRAGRIAAMGPVADIDVPPSALVIDAESKYLMPGLADMHYHLFVGKHDFPLLLANGVTTIRNMSGTPEHLSLRAQVTSGELLGPTIYTAGPIIDGEPPYWPTYHVVSSAHEAEQIVIAQKQLGYDFIKIYMNLQTDMYDAMVAAAKKHGMRIAGHVPIPVGMQHVLDVPIHSLEHLWGYGLAQQAPRPHSNEILVAEADSWRSMDWPHMQTLAVANRRAEIWNCTTLIVRKYMIASRDLERAFARPEIRYVHPMAQRMWNRPHNVFAQMSADEYDILEAGYAKMKMMTTALHEAGARILLGTDAINPFVVPGISLHEELQLLVEAGLTPYEAIRTGTRNAAEFMGQSDVFGTVAVGTRADLVLVAANPLEDVGNAAQIRGVMVRGTWLSQERLAQMLVDLETSVAHMKSRGD